MDPRMSSDQVTKLRSLQNIRKYVVYGALTLLVISLFQYKPLFIYGRVVLWATAGVLSVLEAAALKKLDQPAKNAWINAALYFAVAVFPFLARR